MSGMYVEAASSSDFEAIQGLFRLMFDIFYENQNPEYPYTEGGKGYIASRIQRGFAFVARSEGKTVGFLTGSIQKAIEFKTYDKCGFIENMYVLEEYRKNGTGKMLVDAFVNKCKSEGVEFIHTDSDANQALMNFYTGAGFKITGVNYTMKI